MIVGACMRDIGWATAVWFVLGPLAMIGAESARAEPALTIPAFDDIADRCAPAVAPETLAAVAGAESGFFRLAVHDNTTGASVRSDSEADAIGTASRLIDAGHSLDLGLMQINMANFALLGLTVETAFQPCRSVAAAAWLLSEGYVGGATHAEQQAALRAALSQYNTGDPVRGFANGYVARIERSARHLVPALDPAAPSIAPQHRHSTSGAALSNSPSSGWDVWPSGKPSSPADDQTAILADAGSGAAAPIVTYPRHTEAEQP
ncbi:MAG: type secretion system protein VirB1 [Aliidongia sp.]|jgi:type IV secretion system protein VirB1|nr:type secretion system protein VirB1 [Aliidongia sp.]